MGQLMRRYWVPILLSSEIAEPDCLPVRVQILGEKLLAFRDTSGRPGLIDEFSSHRGASLWFGRNEENGIRCSYHGLKFTVTGECVDVPLARQACMHMRITAYPCIERGGLLWACMRPKEKQPAPPSVEWCKLPSSHVFVSKRQQECNYLQAMEGGIGTSHVSCDRDGAGHAVRSSNRTATRHRAASDQRRTAERACGRDSAATWPKAAGVGERAPHERGR